MNSVTGYKTISTFWDLQVDKRSRARELAVQMLYQFDVRGIEFPPELASFLEENEPDVKVRKVAAEWGKGAWDNVEVCDELISAVATRWNIKRLAIVDKSILRLAVYQLKFCSDIPPKVVLNEAIELAKKFSTDKSPRFVNGVLDAVMKKLDKQKTD
jgi:transcription antitermination factor NusB